MELRPLIRRKKLNCSQGLGPLVIPGSLLVLVFTSFRFFPASFEFGRAVLPADPHDVPPPRRLGHHPDHLVGAALPAAAALKCPTAQRHRELGARRVTGAGGVITHGRGVPSAAGKLAAMLLAPAPHGRRVAAGAVPSARARTAFAPPGAAEADERERSRRREVVELIERPNMHETVLTAVPQALLSHTLTRFRASKTAVKQLPTMP